MTMFSVRRQVFVIGLLFSLIVAWFGSSLSSNRYSWQGWLLSALMALLCGVATIISFHLSSQLCPNGASLKEFVEFYFTGVLSMLCAKQRLETFKTLTRNPRKVQEKTLSRILRRNSGTEYARKTGLDQVSTIDEFRKGHPLSNYIQFEEYIERTAKGENNVIIPTRPHMIVLTSGTTGKPKMIPCSIESLVYYDMEGNLVFEGALNDAKVHSMYPTQKLCQVYTHPDVYKSEAGIEMTIVTKLTKKNIPPVFSSPPSAYEITTDKEAMYIHAIFALKDLTLSSIRSTFCTNLVFFFYEIESNWRDIVYDISTGTINAALNIASDIRKDLSAALKPDPIRAEQLRREFKCGFDGIALRIWPYMKNMTAAFPASFKFYEDILKDKYAKGIVLFSNLYGSSEGLLAVNLWPEKREKQYLFLIDQVFFEFIPFDKSDEDQPETLLIDELTEGESYELVLTTLDGLYRFRFGDVVKVTGFYNKSPIIEVRFRIGDLINLRGERTTEDSLRQAIFDTVVAWELQLVDYTCAEYHLLEAAEGVAKFSTVPYYVIFIETLETPGSYINNIDTQLIDSLLRKTAPMYDEERKMCTIGPPKVILVQPGSFAELRKFILASSNSSVNQFKMPRKLRRKEWIQVLLNNQNE